MTREKLTDELRRLNRVQSTLLRAAKEPKDPASEYLLDAIEQLAITVNELLKDMRE